MRSGIYRPRQLAVFFILLLSFALLLIRLLYLQGIRHNFFFKLADEQHTITLELEPTRGTIFDRNMRVLAVNLNRDSIFANAREISDVKKTASELSRVLGLDEKFLLGRLSRDKAFVWIKRKVTPEEGSRVKSLKLTGIYSVKESKRFYPNKSLACHLLGAVDVDNIGLEGLELVHDKYLKGESGLLISTRDARSTLLESYQDEMIPPKQGFDLVLTIDEVIQNIAERELFKAVEKHNAKAGTIVVMNPKNGDILALANLPNYDLNNFNRRPEESIRNRAINDFFEPGSVFKIIAASGLLDEGLVKMDDKFDCEMGEYRIGTGRRILHDHKPHGILTFREVIELSSNIGTVKAASMLGPEKMHKYMKAFGFYEPTGIGLPGEVTGMNRPVSRWSKVSMFAIPMGQEVTSTAIQLACAISVIADNGYKVRPRIVREIIDEDGRVVKKFAPKAIRKTISPVVAYMMRQLLGGVVERGTGRMARAADYTTGGKTGTAQKVEKSGVYSHSKFIASFIGFAPVDKPEIAVVVCVDEPHPVYFGGVVAAPVFRNVVDQSLKYLNVRDERT